MSEHCDSALRFAHEQRERILNELKEFVSIPSISTDPSAQPEIKRAAEWVAEQMRGIGLEHITIYPTSGHPLVYADWLLAGLEKPTILIYGHYDVQPAEPLDLWETPAFTPTVRGENLFGRGASDMKGQVMASLKAVEALLKTGSLPVNIKFLIEGEEEVGSPNLPAFISNHTNLLSCDFAFNPDSGMLGTEIPTITYGLRGLAYFEIRLKGPDHDLHSGMYGGTVHNPAQVLCELIAAMHDAQGRIMLPGFYDRVQPLSDEERYEMSRLPANESFYLKTTGAPALFGETGYSPVERVGGRPTLEVNGLLSGFTGEGSKTVLPAKAMAKISMRLVPDQDPNEVHQQLLRFMETHTPKTVNWQVIQFAGGPASVTDRNLPAVQALSQAMESTWGVRPVFKREGGSIPVVAQMQSLLGVDSVVSGFGLPDDRVHSPNEKLHLPTFYNGIDALVRFISLLGEA